jgi:SAM-dependent methyltransferase
MKQMYQKFERRKPRIILVTLAYRLFRPFFAFFSAKRRLYLDLEWIFNRLSHEESFRYYGAKDHPILAGTVSYVLSKLQPGSLVLDLGCGYGDVAIRLAEAGHTVVGIDQNEQHIAIARSRYKHPNLSFECQDARKFLAANGRKFNVLILSHVLEHIDAPSEFLRAFSHFFDWVFAEVPDFESTYLNVYRSAIGARLAYTDNDHVTEFDRDELGATLERAGLKVIDREARFGVLMAWCSTK